MKSTIKIDYAVTASKHIPLIKIICPQEIFNSSEDDDIDTRDKLVKDFLQSPGNTKRNNFFELGTYNYLDSTKPSINTIEPIEEQDLFFKFKHALISRLVPDKTLEFIYSLNSDSIKERLNDKNLIQPDGFNEYFKIQELFNLLEDKKN